MRGSKRLTSSRVLIPLGLFVIAYGVRVSYLTQIRRHPAFDSPIMDAAYHDQWARRLAAGDWVGEDVFFRAPLYPYFLGVIYRVFGPSAVAVRLVQFAIGAVTCVLLYFLGVRVAGRAVGTIAGSMAALYGPLIYFEGEMLLPVLEAFFATALLLCLAWALGASQPGTGSGPPPQRPRDQECAACGLAPAVPRRALLSWLAVGVCTGLFAVTRPNILAFVPVLLIYLAIRLGARRGALHGLILLVGVAACVLPVTVRNYVVGGDRVLISSQAGLNFYIGNNPESDGTTAVVPGTRSTWWGGYRDVIAFAEAQSGRSLRPSEVSAFWFGEAFRFIWTQPGQWAKLTARKLLLFWNAFELPNNAQVYDASSFSPLIGALMWKAGPLCFPFGVIGPLALVGLALVVAQRRDALAPTALLLVTYSLTVVAFFVCSRFRIPCVPALLLLAALALVEVTRFLRQRQWRATATSAGALVVALFALNHDFLDICHVSAAKTHVDLGAAYLQKGRLGEAERELRIAVQIDPERAEHKLGLATCLLAQQRPTEAKALFADVLRASPDRPEALVGIADALSQQGAFDLAIPYYRQAIAADPGSSAARRGLGNCLRQLGRGEEAERAYAQQSAEGGDAGALQLDAARLQLERGDFESAIHTCEDLLARGYATAEVRMLLAGAYVNLGQIDRAWPLVEAALAADPDSPGALLLKGVCLWRRGELDLAIDTFQQVVALDPSSVDAWTNLASCHVLKGDRARGLEAATAALELDPSALQARYLRAGCYYEAGDRDKAAEECRTILRQNPAFGPARELLAEVEQSRPNADEQDR